ncbi:MAG: DUF934 domain-containing protein [Halioglobus sp.]|nr:DUF934 domain-containing protein [Halioglobus sp.]
MPKIIRRGVITADNRHGIDADAETTLPGQVCTLAQWLKLADKCGSAVQLEPGQPPAPLLEHLEDIELVVIHFPVLTDGRGFSYGRELRERGYLGELRASGHFIRDQLTYLVRCGFDAFQMADNTDLEAALLSLNDFSEHYQAAVDEPLPLFRRRQIAAS